MPNKETFNTNKSILTLVENTKCYLSTVQFQPLSEIYAEISSKELLETNVNNVALENIGGKTLNFISENLAATLTKKTVGVFGLSIGGFLDSIKNLQDTDLNNTLQEAIEKVIKDFHKEDSKRTLFDVVVQYTQLYEKLRLLNPTLPKEKVFEHLDSLFKKDSSRELTLIYDQFSRAYQEKGEGFSTCFIPEEEDRVAYTITEGLRKSVNSEFVTSYLNIIHTIEKLPLYLQDNTETVCLIEGLKRDSDSYFSSLLKINSSENTVETKRSERMEAFDNFRINSYFKIERYKEEHPETSIQATSFLDKLLWLITKLVPLISKKTRMMMFGGHTKASLAFENISQEVNKIAPSL